MIRPATVADAPGIAALEAELFGAEAWSQAQVTDELTGPGRRGWVCPAAEVRQNRLPVEPESVATGANHAVEHGSAVLPSVFGYLVTMTQGDITDLQRVGVAPAARRTGVASALLDVALAAAREDGAERMLLEVAEDNEPAIGFYAARGFTQIDRRPRYYRHEIAALVLQKDLAE